MSLDTFIAALQQSFGNHLPQILGALAIFALGWLVAVTARAATLRLLSLLGLNRRIEDGTGVEVDIERPIALGVFWLLLLFAVIAVLNVLDLSSLSGPFAAMLGDIVGYLPHLLAGVVLTLVAWLIASLLRGVFRRVLESTGLGERLSRAAGMEAVSTPGGSQALTPETAKGEESALSHSAGNVLFWLVLLLFLPSVLAAFRLSGTLGPVQSMLTEALNVLPNVLAAAVIGFVGVLVARVLRGLVGNLLAAAGADALAERAGLSNSIRPSRLAATLVFLLVLVPSLIAALDALRIEAVSRPASLMLSRLLEAVPHVLAATVILLLSWVVARFVAGLLGGLLESAGADSLPERMGLAGVFGSSRPSRMAGAAVMVFAMLFAGVEAAAQLGFDQVSDLFTTFISFTGDLLLGGVILALGFWLANLVHAALDRAAGESSRGLAGVARVAILGLVLAMGLRAMGIADEIVELAFGLTLGAVAVAVALAFGLGGRDAAARLADHWARRWLQTPPQADRTGGEERNAAGD